MALPTREGYLQKYRNKLAGWENRYFKLDRSYLHYYEAKDSPTPRKTVLRTDISTVNKHDGFPDRSKCLEVVLKNSEKWIVQCRSEFEMKEWGKALLAHVPEYDLRRPEWLSDKPVEPPPLEAPPMPQYMLPPSGAEEPPSYRTVSGLAPVPQPGQYDQQRTADPPSAPYYKS